MNIHIVLYLWNYVNISILYSVRMSVISGSCVCVCVYYSETSPFLEWSINKYINIKHIHGYIYMYVYVYNLVYPTPIPSLSLSFPPSFSFSLCSTHPSSTVFIFLSVSMYLMGQNTFWVWRASALWDRIHWNLTLKSLAWLAQVKNKSSRVAVSCLVTWGCSMIWTNNWLYVTE